MRFREEYAQNIRDLRRLYPSDKFLLIRTRNAKKDFGRRMIGNYVVSEKSYDPKAGRQVVLYFKVK